MNVDQRMIWTQLLHHIVAITKCMTMIHGISMSIFQTSSRTHHASHFLKRLQNICYVFENYPFCNRTFWNNTEF